MFNKGFVKKLNLRRYKRLYAATNDNNWILKYAQEDKSDPMDDFENPSVAIFSKYLLSENASAGEDEVQDRLGQILAAGLIRLYENKGIGREPVLKDWKYGELEDSLHEYLIPVSSTDLALVREHAVSLLDSKNSSVDKKLSKVISMDSTILNGIRYALIKAYDSFYGFFVYLNPIVDFLPQGKPKIEAIPLSASQVESLKKVAAGRKKKTLVSQLLTSYSGPRLDDLIEAFRANQVKLQFLKINNQINDELFARYQVINDGHIRHLEKGRESLKRYMEEEKNRRSRYFSKKRVTVSVGKNTDGTTQSLEDIASLMQVSARDIEDIMKKADPDFDPDFLDVGTELTVPLMSELLTDNMYVGNIGDGRSYDSLSELFRIASDVSKGKKKSSYEDYPYYKNWKGEPEFFTRAQPSNVKYIQESFVEEVVSTPSYRDEFVRDHLKNLKSFINYTSKTASENREDIKVFATVLGGDESSDDFITFQKEALEHFFLFMNTVREGLENLHSLEVKDIPRAYESLVRDTKDVVLASIDNEYTSDARSYLSSLVPANFEVGKFEGSVFVRSPPSADGSGGKPKSTMDKNQVSNFYKAGVTGKDIIGYLSNSNGYLTEKYSKNESEYDDWEDKYGENAKSLAIKAMRQSSGLIDDKLLTSLDIVAPQTHENRDEFLVSVWKFFNKNTELEKIKEMLGSISYQALFVYLSSQINTLFESELGVYVTSNFLNDQIKNGMSNLSISEQSQFRNEAKQSFIEEEGSTNSGGGGFSESKREIAERVWDEGSDVNIFFEQRRERMYEKVDRNNLIQTQSLGGEFEDIFRSKSSFLRDLFEIKEGEEGKIKGRMLNFIKSRTVKSFGKQSFDRNSKDMSALYKSTVPGTPNSRDEAMEMCGAFADIFHTRENLEKRAALEEKRDELEREFEKLGDFESVFQEEGVYSEEVIALKKRKESLDRNIARLNADTAVNAFQRAHSKVGAAAPHEMVEKYRRYFNSKMDEYTKINKDMGILMVRFKKDSPTTNDPFSADGSPRKMTAAQISSIFANMIDVGEHITKPVDLLLGKVSSISFEQVEERKSFVLEGEVLIKKLSKKNDERLVEELQRLTAAFSSLSSANDESSLSLAKNEVFQALMILQESSEEIAEQEKEKINEIIENLSTEEVIEEKNESLEVNSVAAGYNYLRNLRADGIISEQAEMDLTDLFSTMKKEDGAFSETKSFVKVLLRTADEKNVSFSGKENIMNMFPSEFQTAAYSSDPERASEALKESPTLTPEPVHSDASLEEKLRLFISKYSYLESINIKNESSEKKLNDLLSETNMGLDESHKLADAVSKLDSDTALEMTELDDRAMDLDESLIDLKEEIEQKLLTLVSDEIPLSTDETETNQDEDVKDFFARKLINDRERAKRNAVPLKDEVTDYLDKYRYLGQLPIEELEPDAISTEITSAKEAIVSMVALREKMDELSDEELQLELGDLLPEISNLSEDLEPVLEDLEIVALNSATENSLEEDIGNENPEEVSDDDIFPLDENPEEVSDDDIFPLDEEPEEVSEDDILPLEEEVSIEVSENDILPLEEEVVEEVSENDIIPLEEEVVEEVSENDIIPLEEGELSFKPLAGYTNGAVLGNVVEEDEDVFWVYDKKKGLKYNVSPNYDGKWHAIWWAEPIEPAKGDNSSVLSDEMLFDDIFGKDNSTDDNEPLPGVVDIVEDDIVEEVESSQELKEVAAGIRGLIDFEDDMVDEANSTSGILTIASLLEAASLRGIRDKKVYLDMVNKLDLVIKTPTVQELRILFTGVGLSALKQQIQSAVNAQKQSRKKGFDLLQKKSAYEIEKNRVDKDDKYYF